RLAAAARRELVERGGDERPVPVQPDGREEDVEVGAADVAAEGDARAVRAQVAGALAAGVAGRRSDPEDIVMLPRPVAAGPDNGARRDGAVLEAARFGQPLVLQAAGMAGVHAFEDVAETERLCVGHRPSSTGRCV